MEVLSREGLKKIDNIAVNDFKIPSILLMENAGERIKNKIINEGETFIIVCGIGNNGGDGLVIARKLILLHKNVHIFIIGNTEKGTEDFKLNLKILLNMKAEINSIKNESDLNILKNIIKKDTVILDALFGIGLSRKIEGIYTLVIECMNRSKRIISIDVPSGVDCNTGEILGCCVKAYKTITVEAMKRGFIYTESIEVLGDVSVVEIDIPKEIKAKLSEKVYILPKEVYIKKMPKRKKTSHKGDFGKVAIIGGSENFVGAVYISSEAAIRAGSGLVTLIVNNKIANILRCKVIEAMVKGYDNTYEISELERFNAIAIGPGMGTSKEATDVFEKVIKNTKCPLVIDADGLNILSKNKEYFNYIKGRAVITPHLGEMSRLIGKTIEEIELDKIEISKKFAKEKEVVVLLKGYNTIITDGEEVIINRTGNSKMASGGMGDCLTGIITSFIGQGLTIKESSILSAYIHGYIGDYLGRKLNSVNARDIIDNLPKIIEELLCEN